MPQLPPAQQAAMADRLGTTDKIVGCVTPEEAKANKVFFTGNDDKNCKYDHFVMAGGKFDVAMNCADEGRKTSATLTGTYSPTRYHMTRRRIPRGRRTVLMVRCR